MRAARNLARRVGGLLFISGDVALRSEAVATVEINLPQENEQRTIWEESLGPLADGFEIIDKHWQLYRKGTEVRTPVDPRRRSVMAVNARLASAPVVMPARHSLGQLLSVYDALLEETMPPSLLLNERGELRPAPPTFGEDEDARSRNKG